MKLGKGQGRGKGGNLPGPGEKTCPFCAETIKAGAIRCRFCQSDLPAPAAAADDDSDPSLTTAGGATSSDHLRLGLEPDPEGGRERRGLTGFLRSGVLSTVLALCVLASASGLAYSWWRSEHPDEGRAPDGVITSTSARDAGMTAATELTQKVLSYNWVSLEADIEAAQAVCAPTFRKEYLDAMNNIRQQTVDNQVKLVATPVATSIVSASKEEVEALVFVNQKTTAKNSENQRLDANRILVTLTREKGDWRIAKMKAF